MHTAFIIITTPFQTTCILSSTSANPRIALQKSKRREEIQKISYPSGLARDSRLPKDGKSCRATNLIEKHGSAGNFRAWQLENIFPSNPKVSLRGSLRAAKRLRVVRGAGGGAPTLRRCLRSPASPERKPLRSETLGILLLGQRKNHFVPGTLRRPKSNAIHRSRGKLVPPPSLAVSRGGAGEGHDVNRRIAHNFPRNSILAWHYARTITADIELILTPATRLQYQFARGRVIQPRYLFNSAVE